ncbi:MAG: hypothetical protein WC340_16540, partial [Kiritimatiellia bacterium]
MAEDIGTRSSLMFLSISCSAWRARALLISQNATVLRILKIRRPAYGLCFKNDTSHQPSK